MSQIHDLIVDRLCVIPNHQSFSSLKRILDCGKLFNEFTEAHISAIVLGSFELNFDKCVCHAEETAYSKIGNLCNWRLRQLVMGRPLGEGFDLIFRE